jgi:hypothetical protein
LIPENLVICYNIIVKRDLMWGTERREQLSRVKKLTAEGSTPLGSFSAPGVDELSDTSPGQHSTSAKY